MKTINHSDNFDHDSPQYINTRLHELERFFQDTPDNLMKVETDLLKAKAAHAEAEAWARLEADGRDVKERDGQVLLNTKETADAVLVAEIALRYAKAQVAARNSEREVLVTRSVNMRTAMKG